MNGLIIRNIKNIKVPIRNVKMLVLDMSGTTINDNGLVYKTLLDTIREFNLNVNKKDIHKWYGLNTHSIMDGYFNNQVYDIDTVRLETYRKCLYNKFETSLKEQYFESDALSLIDDELPDKLESIRRKDIKITLNTGLNKKKKKMIIDKLGMRRYIDDYISNEQVSKDRPYPYMIYKLMERNNICSPQNVIKIGDTRADIYEGRNAQCLASIGVLSGVDIEEGLYHASHIMDSVMSISVD